MNKYIKNLYIMKWKKSISHKLSIVFGSGVLLSFIVFLFYALSFYDFQKANPQQVAYFLGGFGISMIINIILASVFFTINEIRTMFEDKYAARRRLRIKRKKIAKDIETEDDLFKEIYLVITYMLVSISILIINIYYGGSLSKPFIVYIKMCNAGIWWRSKNNKPTEEGYVINHLAHTIPEGFL